MRDARIQIVTSCVPILKAGSEGFWRTVDALADARKCSREEAEYIVRALMTEDAKDTKTLATISIPAGAISATGVVTIDIAKMSVLVDGKPIEGATISRHFKSRDE